MSALISEHIYQLGVTCAACLTKPKLYLEQVLSIRMASRLAVDLSEDTSTPGKFLYVQKLFHRANSYTGWPRLLARTPEIAPDKG